jgi:hypothetical protein
MSTIYEDEGVKSGEMGDGYNRGIAIDVFVFHGGPLGGIEALDGLWWAVEGTNDGVHCWERFTETLDVERVEIGSDVEPEFDGETVVGHDERGAFNGE